MRHFASPAFWGAYAKLPDPVRELADRNYAMLKSDPRHPSLHFSRWSAGRRSVRAASLANRHCRALGSRSHASGCRKGT